LARQSPGYGEVVFPHCGCDARKEGHVIPSLGFNAFRLQACKEDGSLQVSEKKYHFPKSNIFFILPFFFLADSIRAKS
jgi:sorting nexin-27